MGYFVALGINAVIAFFIYKDVKKFEQQGVKTVPIIWALATVVFSIFILPLYWLIRYAFWDVQVKAIQDPASAESIKKNTWFRLVVFLIGFILFALMAGCDKPLWAHFVHQKVRVGMTTGEVQDILTRYKGFHRQRDTGGFEVLFMGPVFLHNSFDIQIDKNGKVSSVTPVMHWD
jgi:hypothetical protein